MIAAFCLRLHPAARGVLFAIAVLVAKVEGQQPAADSNFTFSQVMVTMRDGVRLNTTLFVPRMQAGPLPILFVRTPYGVPGAEFPLSRAYAELVAEGYIFAFQDIRGKYASEGTFVMQRAPRPVDAGARAIDESTDAYDSVEWLTKALPRNNGRVGMLGVSYPGWTTAMAMLDPHPALKAVSPQASPADMWMGDDFHHNGAFRLSYGFEYSYMVENAKGGSQFQFDTYDTYDWYLKLGALSNAQSRYLKDKKLPTWDDFRLHPNYDEFWQRQAMKPYLKRVTVPTLNVAGWWDQEDFYGPVTIYRELEKHDTKSNNFLVVGPWNHGGWSRGSGQKLGAIDFGSATGEFYRSQIQAPFFAYYLKDKGTLKQPEATVFESGSNTWRTFTAWPPKEATRQSLYFRANGRLSFSAPGNGESGGYDSYVSDPAHPVPYRHRPIEPTYYPKGSGWPVWLLEDQRFVSDRPDVVHWETEPLTADVVVAGDITAKLFASTTGQDADFVVKLIDVYPEDYQADFKLSGYELMVANDVFRARFRDSFEKPTPMVPGQITPVTVDLHTQSYRFKRGHKIMVHVQSSWFPLIDRNPQTWVPNIFEAKEADYKAQTHRIWRTPANASRVDLSTVKP
ncbi:MAG TPA: CocE/NonD family hydrolase [Gemmatimonadaceae bacterium]|nr:CocE/NonD family hydrolase [Gemmatimonadaceae bacterium]